MVDNWQCSKYASSSEYASVTQGFEVTSPSYMFDRALSIPRVLNIPGLNIKGLWIWEGYTEFCVNCILKSVNRLLSQKVPKKHFIVYTWQVLNIPRYTSVLVILGFIKKTLHHRCLTGFWILLRFWIYQGP